MKSFVVIIPLIFTLLCCQSAISNQIVGDDTESNSLKEMTEENNKLSGKWVLIKADSLPLRYSHTCFEVGLESIYEFQENGKLSIYPSGSKKPCDSYAYTVQGTFLSIAAEDMMFAYDVAELNAEKLVLKEQFPPYNELVFRKY